MPDPTGQRLRELLNAAQMLREMIDDLLGRLAGQLDVLQRDADPDRARGRRRRR
jgi:hypothetical protein